MALVSALSVAIRMTENWYILEQEKKELENARSEAELQNLKSQLNPHFLFNTLNNIYSLIAIDPDRAQFAVHDLSRLLRHVLYEDNQKFVFHEELYRVDESEVVGKCRVEGRFAGRWERCAGRSVVVYHFDRKRF